MYTTWDMTIAPFFHNFCKSRRIKQFEIESSFLFQDSSPGMNENDAKLLARKVHQFLSQKTSKFKFAFSEVQVLSQVTMASLVKKSY